MRIEREILNSNKIKEINDALFLIRHFVDVSAKLLPILAEISELKNPSYKDISDKEKILAVFHSYSFDVHSSEILMNSPILQLIQEAYNFIDKGDVKNSRKSLYSFWLEHDKLNHHWKLNSNN